MKTRTLPLLEGNSPFSAIFRAAGCLILLVAMTLPVHPKSGVKTSQSEARTIMTGIYESKMAFFSVNNSFSDGPALIGYAPAAPRVL